MNEEEEENGDNGKKDGKRKKNWSIRQTLLEDRKIFLRGSINARLAHRIMGELLYLETQDPEEEILLYINSPGGEVTSGMAIYDTMQHIKPPVVTIVAGLAASMGSVILAGGKRGRRLAFPHSRVLIHQPLGGVSGQATDIEIHAREILKVKQRLNHLLARRTGQDLKIIERDTNRDLWFTAHEAKEYGLLDEVLESEEK